MMPEIHFLEGPLSIQVTTLEVSLDIMLLVIKAIGT